MWCPICAVVQLCGGGKMDPMNPKYGDIFTYYDDELVTVIRANGISVEVETEDGVPIIYSLRSWRKKVEEGIYR